MNKCVMCGTKIKTKDLKYRSPGEHHDSAKCMKCKEEIVKNEGQ